MDAFGSLELFNAFDGPKYLSSCPPPDNAEDMEGEGQEIKEESEDIEAIKAENTLLRSRLRIYDKLSHLIASETPIAEIDYFKSELSIESQYRIESELYTLMSETRELQEEHAPDGTEGPHGHVLYLPNYMIDSSGRFFNVIPSEFGDNKPLYPQIYTVALDDCDDKLDMFGSKLPDQGAISSGPGCFNCGGPHIISECKLPRDQKKIAEARKEFQQTKSSNSRYHVRSDAEIDEKYKGFLPGVMSDSLRLALGLEDSELPSHVYRMRNFGYPPGYSMEPPKENSKGLILYETPSIIRGSEEDGEVSDAPQPTVIPFPGYTAPLEDGVIDKYRIRNNPYNAVTPSLNDKRKPKVRPTKRRRVEAPTEDDDSMEVDNIGGEDITPATAVPSYLRPTMAPLSDSSTPPLPSDTPPSSPHPPPPVPTDTPPSQRAPPPLPKDTPSSPLPKLDLDQDIEEGECDETPAEVTTVVEAEATDEVTDEVTDKDTDKTAEETTAEASTTEPEAESSEATTDTTEHTEEAGCNGANMSIVSETNKIGIKFDTVEDYGPLDQRAGNFTRLQSILRSRKKSTTKDK